MLSHLNLFPADYTNMLNKKKKDVHRENKCTHNLLKSSIHENKSLQDPELLGWRHLFQCIVLP